MSCVWSFALLSLPNNLFWVDNIRGIYILAVADKVYVLRINNAKDLTKIKALFLKFEDKLTFFLL